MPLLKFDNLDIFYKVYGSGPLLILHHGFGSQGNDWIKPGWVDGLIPYATVLTFDAVGHGRSTKSHDYKDHEIEKRAEIVLALAENLGMKKLGFLGFSMGARTGLELAASHPEKLSILIIGGMNLEPAYTDRLKIERRIRVLKSGRAKNIEKPNKKRPANDPLSLAAANEALLRWKGVENRLNKHNAPTLMFCGDKDKYFLDAKKSSEDMNFSFVELSGEDHYSSFGNCSKAVREVVKFVHKELKP